MQVREQEKIRALAFRKRTEEILKKGQDGDGVVPPALGPNEDLSTKEIITYAVGLVLLLIVLGLGIVFGLIWYFDSKA